MDNFPVNSASASRQILVSHTEQVSSGQTDAITLHRIYPYPQAVQDESVTLGMQREHGLELLMWSPGCCGHKQFYSENTFKKWETWSQFSPLPMPWGVADGSSEDTVVVVMASGGHMCGGDTVMQRSNVAK